MRTFPLALMLVALLACSTPAQQPAPAAGDATAAGKLGDRTITITEVDARWQQVDPIEHLRASQMLYDGRKDAFDRIVAELLIEGAAKSKGLPAAEYEKAEIAKRLKPITDADVTAFYQQNEARMQGRSLDQMRDAIGRYLNEQQAASARAALVDELRKDAPAIQTYLDAPRKTVTVGPRDPSRGPATAAVTLVEFSDYQ